MRVRAGEEIQFLSRFVGAQRLAFQKLLKKYKRWTGSPTLGRRFTKEVLDSPTSFSRRDFEPLLAQWVNVLTTVRAPFKDGVMWKAGYGGRRTSSANIPDTPPVRTEENKPAHSGSAINKGQRKMISSAAQIQNILVHESTVDFDTALATSPLGSAAGKATYWVHSDNLVELQVLLLQHMKSPIFQGAASSPDDTNRRGSRSSSSASEELGDEVGLLVFDDLDRFARSQSDATIREMEDTAGRAVHKPAGTARWCDDSEAVVVVRLSPDAESPKGNSTKQTTIQTAKLKRKKLSSLFDSSQTAPFSQSPSDVTNSSSPASDKDESTTQSVAIIKSWLAEHDQARPLVEISSRRKRFVGLTNTSTGGVWGVLDREVSMENLVLEPSRHTDSGQDAKNNMSFPHAVLEIRWEGENNARLAHVLDQSHLVSSSSCFLAFHLMW